MDIELNLREQEPTSSANGELVLKDDELTIRTAAEEPAGNVLSNNLGSAVSTSSEPQPQQQRDVAINIDARFGPSCAPILSDVDIVNNIIEASERADRRNWLYLFVGCIPTLAITCPVWIAWAAIKCSPNLLEENCSTSHFLYILGIVSASITGLIFLWAIVYGARNYSNEIRYITLRSNVRSVVKLEGDQWTKYVNYLYGFDREGFNYLGTIGGMSFCCRKSQYQQLIERGYGYIVFCQRGFILDEMCHIVRNDPHVILKVTYIFGMGLRVYLVRRDGTYTVSKYASEAERHQAGLAAISAQTVPFDIYLPNTMPQNVAALLCLQVQYGL